MMDPPWTRLSYSQKNIHHGATETLRKTKSKAKPEHTEVTEDTETKPLRAKPPAPPTITSMRLPGKNVKGELRSPLDKLKLIPQTAGCGA